MNRNEALYQLFERCIFLKTACKSTKIIVNMDLIVSDMSEYLANDNLKYLAMKYLELCNPKQSNVALLKERVFISDSSRQLAKFFAKPQPSY
jgi:hypothetical protein